MLYKKIIIIRNYVANMVLQSII
uniref:Uncharacterized protein n=1 Tax=Rhizophora mucronata TaxID=61149 RepID=A0A2P2R502_RHIMU